MAQENAETLDKLSNLLDDIKHSYTSLIEKVGHLQMEMDGLGLEDELAQLAEPLNHLSLDFEAIKSVHEALEMAANRARQA